MAASIRARLLLVLTTTVFTFVGMAVAAALVTILKDSLRQPLPDIRGAGLSLVSTPVQTTRQVALLPKLSFPAYKREHADWLEEKQKKEKEEKEEENKKNKEEKKNKEKKKNDDAALLFFEEEKEEEVGPRGKSSLRLIRAFLERRARSLSHCCSHFFSPLSFLNFFKTIINKNNNNNNIFHPSSSPRDPLRYSITSSPYVDAETGELEENCMSALSEADRLRFSSFLSHYPQLLGVERRTDALTIFLSGEVDFHALWDWNTKAIYIAFLARYETNKTRVNEVIFLDAIVRDVSLPWSLRHLRKNNNNNNNNNNNKTAAAARSPEEKAALEEFLQSVRHPVHDANGVFINHVDKTVRFEKAAKYVVSDLYAGTLSNTGVEVVMRYQVMSYSGWAPVLELPPAKTGPIRFHPVAAQL